MILMNNNFAEIKKSNNYVAENASEKLIKDKLRVQKHAEVFTPSWMVEKMLGNEEIKKACNSLSTTFLEPSAGEGVFLISILKKKLDIVEKKYSQTLIQYENYSLFVLSTIYGIELLEDNAQMCVMNLFEEYNESYTRIANKFGKKPRKNVLRSAKVIIKANIVQGNFLTKKTSNNEPIIFSEWKSENRMVSDTKIIYVSRTEYSLEDIFEDNKTVSGKVIIKANLEYQPSFFSDENLDNMIENYQYTKVRITNVYKEELCVGE